MSPAVRLHDTNLPFISFKHKDLVIQYRYLNNGLMEIMMLKNNELIEYNETHIMGVIDRRERNGK